MEQKFKVGKTIRIVKADSWHVQQMDNLIGKEFIIESFDYNVYCLKDCDNFAGVAWSFTGEGFELVKKEKKEKPLHKFNVGDRVKVINPKVGENQVGGYEEQMDEMRDRIFTIDYQQLIQGMSAYSLVGEGHTWDERCLKRVRKAKPVEEKAAIMPEPVAPIAEEKEKPKEAIKILNVKQEFMKKLRERVGDNAGTCSYGKLFKDGTEEWHIRDVCHARIPSRDAGKISCLALDLRGHIRGHKYVKYYHKYVQYILTYSPFASSFLTKGIESALKNGISMDVERPCWQLAASAIALREGSEYPEMLKMFNSLLEKGYSGNTAYLLSRSFQTNGVEEIVFFQISNAHKVLHSQMEKSSLFKFFKDGFPSHEEDKPYKTSHASYGSVIASRIAPYSVKESIDLFLKSKTGIKASPAWGERMVVKEEVFYSLADLLETELNSI